MKLRNTAIALGVGAATAAGLSLLKVNKEVVIGSTAVVVGAGLMIALKEEDTSKNPSSLTSIRRPIKRDAIQNVLETELENFNPTVKTYATWKALKRLAWVMEDDDSEEDEFYDFILDRSETVSSPEKFVEWMKDILYSDDYDNENPEWLESEWDIGPSSEVHAFNSKESFLNSFDSDFTYKIFSKCWEIACSNDLYELNDYESWEDTKYWFYKDKIWIIDSDKVTQYYLKTETLQKLLDDSQLETFYNFEIEKGISVLEIGLVKEVNETLNWMNKTDLIKFYDLPLELLDNLENPSAYTEEEIEEEG